MSGTMSPVERVQTAVHCLPFRLVEPKRGYRFGPENLALYELLTERTSGASTLRPTPASIIDLGAGSGVLGFLAAAAHPTAALTLVERSPVLADVARENARRAAAAGLGGVSRVSVIEHDIRDWRPDVPADLVVANPPYFAPGEGRESSHDTTREATHAYHGGVEEFAFACARALAPRGSAYLVYPADRAPDALLALQRAGLAARDVLVLNARHTGRAYRAWIRAERDEGPCAWRHACTWTER